MTFTFNGGGNNTGAINIPVYRRGNIVTVRLVASLVRATTGTTSTTFASGNNLPSWAQPTAGIDHQGVYIRNNAGADSTSNGVVEVSTAGAITIYRNLALLAWTNTASGGLSTDYHLTYAVV